MTLSNYIEWCNENEARSYPIAEHATSQTVSNKQLPTDIIADIGVVVPEQYSDVYISSVRVTPVLYSVCVACSTAPLLVCTVTTSDYVPYQAVAMSPQVDDVTGWIVFGNHQATAATSYTFTAAIQTGLASRAVRTIDSLPVTKLLKYGGSVDQYVDKLVRLVGGNNLRIYQDPNDAQTILLELEAGACQDFLGPCDVYPDAGGCNLQPIRDINGVTANSSGILTLRFGE
jgi:hypothetical protein